jgi:hypothetical protein
MGVFPTRACTRPPRGSFFNRGYIEAKLRAIVGEFSGAGFAEFETRREGDTRNRFRDSPAHVLCLRSNKLRKETAVAGRGVVANAEAICLIGQVLEGAWGRAVVWTAPTHATIFGD